MPTYEMEPIELRGGTPGVPDVPHAVQRALAAQRAQQQQRGMLPLDQLSHGELLMMRALAQPDEQAALAPAEHRAFAREWTEENPLRAAIAMPLLIPGYSAAKALGLTEQDAQSTPASWDEISQGFKGFGEGMLSALRGRPQPLPAQRGNIDGRMIPRPGMLPRPLPSAVGVRD